MVLCIILSSCSAARGPVYNQNIVSDLPTLTEAMKEIESTERVNASDEAVTSSMTSNMPSDGLYKVERVYDGDTFYINVNGETESVRMLCIDTPELKSEDPYAKEARDFLSEIIEGNTIYIEFGQGKDRTGRDVYDRLLGYAFIDEVNINGLLVQNGLARVAYIFEPDTKYVAAFNKLEAAAKQEEKGIWSIPDYVTKKGFSR